SGCGGASPPPAVLRPLPLNLSPPVPPGPDATPPPPPLSPVRGPPPTRPPPRRHPDARGNRGPLGWRWWTRSEGLYGAGRPADRRRGQGVQPVDQLHQDAHAPAGGYRIRRRECGEPAAGTSPLIPADGTLVGDVGFELQFRHTAVRRSRHSPRARSAPVARELLVSEVPERQLRLQLLCRPAGSARHQVRLRAAVLHPVVVPSR